jgi:hypothetical protein
MSELKLRPPKDKEGERIYPLREKREESFMRVEITGAWHGLGRRKGLGEELF